MPSVIAPRASLEHRHYRIQDIARSPARLESLNTRASERWPRPLAPRVV